MPTIYLSPSLQEYNPYLTGGSEEEYMNLIVDAMESYLTASGIGFLRNDPAMSLGEAIQDSNQAGVDFHLAIHSNAAPESLAGQLQGPDIYYFAGSRYGEEMANIIADAFREIYPDAEKVNAVPTVTLRELRRTTAPSALVEVAYHDQADDETWIKENIDTIARALSKAVAEYFGVPFVEPQ